MAKLYARLEDENGTEVHKQAYRELEFKVYYGSSGDSRLCLHILVTANQKDSFKAPEVFIDSRTDVKAFELEQDYVKEAISIANRTR